MYGLDLDYEGNVLVEAQGRAREASVPIHLVQANALRPATWSWLAASGPPLGLINCIGLAPWLTGTELRALLVRFAAHLGPTGYVLIDRWNQGKHARWARAAEIHPNYHTHGEYEEHIGTCGYTLLEAEVLGEEEGMGYLLQKGHQA